MFAFRSVPAGACDGVPEVDGRLCEHMVDEGYCVLFSCVYISDEYYIVC